MFYITQIFGIPSLFGDVPTIINCGEFLLTVLEVGIFRNSVLVLHKSFYPLDHVSTSMNYQRRSNLINQIQKMGEIVLKRDVEFLDNPKYRIHFAVPKSYDNMFIYAIEDKQSSMKIMKDLLNTLLIKFKEYYPILNRTPKIQEIDQYKHFSTIIDQTLSDERFTPLDRIKRFLL